MRRIVVTLRTCPTRLLGPYGCEWVETPTLDRLAAEGVVFDGHYSPLPSGERGGGEGRPHGEQSSCHYVADASEFDLSDFAGKLANFSKAEAGDFSIVYDPFAFPFDEWDDGPLTRTDDNRESFFETVAGPINTFDAQMKSLIERLNDRGLLDSFLFILTARSGFPVGEHGVLGPSHSRLHEELVHLPLIVRFPDRRLAGYRVAGITTPDDLTAPLEPFILGERPARESVVSRRDNEVSLRTAESCLILPLGDNPLPPLLFDRPDDRFEVHNLAPSQPDRVEALKGPFNADSADFRRTEE